MAYKSILDQILDDSAPVEVVIRKSASQGQDVDPLADLLDSAKRTGRQSPDDWRGKSASAVTGEGLLAETSMRVAGQSGANSIEKVKLSSAQVGRKISDLLHLGYTPERVASEMTKWAELHAWDRQMSADTLKDMSGTVGIAFLEPNHFNTCQETYDKIKSSGDLRAFSVKRIAACGSCNKCVNKSHCSLFKLPIVASKQELKDVVVEKMASMGKKASKSALVDLHNRKADKPTVSAPGNHDSGAVGGFGSLQRTAQKVVTASQVAQMASTTDFFSVYNTLLPQYGKVATKKAMSQFIAGLKTAGTKVDVNLIDCKFLAGKLAAGNAITGSAKCAGCTKRCDMHCGLTGGTLISFPGMDRVTTNKRAHAGAKEGQQVLSEWELDSFSHVTATHGDIDVSGYSYDDIQSHGPLDLE